jgi:heme/copper-type cytochrome/quinol oxidase subunit 3
MSHAAADPAGALRPAADTPRAPGAHGGRVGAAGMWTFLATDAMGFGGLFIAYAVLRVHADVWPEARARLALGPAALMTFALLASSLTMTLATRAEARGRRLGWLAATLALGLAFLGGAITEDVHLAGAGVGMGFATDLYASTFYALTGYHGLHVLAGVVALAAMLRPGVPRKSLDVLALYWHFVDLAWMPIFTFVYLLP